MGPRRTLTACPAHQVQRQDCAFWARVRECHRTRAGEGSELGETVFLSRRAHGMRCQSGMNASTIEHDPSAGISEQQ